MMANYPHPPKGSRHAADSQYRSGVRRQLREDRQVQARIRNEAYAKLSAKEKLARLNAAGLTATKQRARIAAEQAAAEDAVIAEKAKPQKKKAKAS